MNKKAIRRLLFKSILILYFITHLFPAFKSIPRIPDESFYIPIWLGVLVLVKPAVYFTREFVASALFLCVHVMYLAIGHYDALNLSVIETQGEIFQGVFFALSLWAYLRLERDRNLVRILGWVILTGIIITSITTIFGIFNNPYAARTLIGNDNPEEVLGIMRLNVGGYSFQFMLAIVGPLFIYFYIKSRKSIWLLAFAGSSLSILYAQVVAVLMIYLLNIGISLLLLYGISFKRYLLLCIIGGSIFLYGSQRLAQFLYFLSEHLQQFEMAASKFNEVAIYLETSGEVDYVRAENISAYKERYEISKMAFLEKPWMGGAGKSGGHHFWIDNLAEHGILGTIPWVFVVIGFLTSANKFFTYEEMILVLNALIIFLLIGINKNILIYSMPIYPFFMVPLFLIFNKLSMVKQQAISRVTISG